MISPKAFTFFSFIPAMAYWYLEANYSLQIALAGGLILAVIEMAVEWIFTRHIHTISKVNFYLILVLGGIAFAFQDGIWFKLQPAFTGWLMGAYILYRVLRKQSLLLEMASEMGQNLPPKPIMEMMERNLGLFMFGYGSFMAGVAVYATTDQWLFFKTIGFYICCFIFLILQIVITRQKMRRILVKRS